MDDMTDIRNAVLKKFSIAKQPVKEDKSASEPPKAELESSRTQPNVPEKESKRKDLGLSTLAEVLKRDIDIREDQKSSETLESTRKKLIEKKDNGLLKGLIKGMG